MSGLGPEETCLPRRPMSAVVGCSRKHVRLAGFDPFPNGPSQGAIVSPLRCLGWTNEAARVSRCARRA
jgi:hypothetical protein